MYSVEFPRLRRILFSPAPVPIEFHAEIRDDLGGEAREGVTLDIPPNVHRWPDGQAAPQAILGVSLVDPGHYRVFKYARDIDPADFRPAGLDWGMLPSASGWGSFMENIRTLNRIAREARGGEPPDAFDESEDLAPAGRVG